MVEVSLGGSFQGGVAKGIDAMEGRDVQREQLGLQREELGLKEKDAQAAQQEKAAALLEKTVEQIVQLKAAAPDEGEFSKVQPIIAELIKDAVALAPSAGRNPDIIGKRLQVALQFAPTIMGAAEQKGKATGAETLAAAPAKAAAAGMETTAQTQARLAAENSPEAIRAEAQRAGAVSQAQAQGTARGTPKGPESPEGKKVADRMLFVTQYGENSPQVKAFDESLNPTASTSDVASTRKEYIASAKDFVTVRDAFGKISVAKDNPSAAGDIGLIFNFMKMLDPGSTVREGEFATAQNATGVPGQIVNAYNRAASGERLAPEQRQDFLNQAENIFRVQLRSQIGLENQYKALAERLKMKPEDVVIDLVGEFRPAVGGKKTEAGADDPLGILGGK